MPMKSALFALGVLTSAAAPALAQSDIDPTNKFSWEENCGWMNWRDADSGAQGVRDRGTFLSGYVWCENAGWVNVGNGSPKNGINYSNASGLDFGVNIAATGSLSGYAWGENVGWINFGGGALATPPQPARLDSAASRFRGYAWGENIGWVNLDLSIPGQYVGRTCYANCDNSTTAPVLNALDFACFLNKFAAGDAYSNCDRSTTPPVLNVLDFACFLNSFAAGCS
jgi:hypothetical protein